MVDATDSPLQPHLTPISSPDHAVRSHRWLMLGVMLIAVALDLIDVTVVNIALPSLSASFAAGPVVLEWVLTGYTLAFGVLLITGGRLGDAWGHRRLFLLGAAGFVTASGLCGAAWRPEVLIGARVLQGACGAMMIPQVLSVIQKIFPNDDRRRAFALYGTVVAASTLAGPLVGGLLVETDPFGLSWRSVFLINMPVGVVALVGAWWLLPEFRTAGVRQLDLIGLGLVSLTLLILLFPLVRAAAIGLPWWSIALLVTSAPMLALFVWRELCVQRAGGAPLIPIRLFASCSFSSGVFAQMVIYSGVNGLLLVTAVTFQSGLRYSAFATGLIFLPWAAGIAMATLLTGRLARLSSRSVSMGGAVLMAGGAVTMLAAVELAGPRTGPWQLMPGLLLAGIGMGVVGPAVIDVSLVQVSRSDAGAASGVVNTAGQIGNSIGIALIGVLFFGGVKASLTTSASAAAAYLSAFGHALVYETVVFVCAAMSLMLIRALRSSSGI